MQDNLLIPRAWAAAWRVIQDNHQTTTADITPELGERIETSSIDFARLVAFAGAAVLGQAFF